MLNGWVKSIAI